MISRETPAGAAAQAKLMKVTWLAAPGRRRRRARLSPHRYAWRSYRAGARLVRERGVGGDEGRRAPCAASPGTRPGRLAHTDAFTVRPGGEFSAQVTGDGMAPGRHRLVRTRHAAAGSMKPSSRFPAGRNRPLTPRRPQRRSGRESTARPSAFVVWLEYPVVVYCRRRPVRYGWVSRFGELAVVYDRSNIQ